MNKPQLCSYARKFKDLEVTSLMQGKPYYYYFPKTFGTNRLMPRFPLLFENNGISIAKQANHDCWIFLSYWCRNVFVYALMPGIKSRFVRHSAKNLEATPWWISSSKISIFYGILLGERPAKSFSYSKDWRGQTQRESYPLDMPHLSMQRL